MIERIRALEAISRRLEPGKGKRASVTDAVVDYGERFLERLPQLKAYEIDKEAAKKLRDSPIADEGVGVGPLLELFDEAVIAPGVNPASDRFLAYIPGGGIYYSSLGDYLAAVTNRYAGVRFAGPGAVEMENMLLDWMADLVGYPEGSGGNLSGRWSMYRGRYTTVSKRRWASWDSGRASSVTCRRTSVIGLCRRSWSVRSVRTELRA
jgi:hypothetical protein